MKVLRAVWDSWWCRGILFFVASYVVMAPLLGPTRCRDGWHSPSIGIPGACSHHGGVGSRQGSWIFWIALVVGGGAAFRAFDKAEKAAARQRLSDKGIDPDAWAAATAEIRKARSEQVPPSPIIQEPREPRDASVEAMRVGEQRTKEYLQAYFSGRPSPSKKTPPKRRR